MPRWFQWTFGDWFGRGTWEVRLADCNPCQLIVNPSMMNHPTKHMVLADTGTRLWPRPSMAPILSVAGRLFQFLLTQKDRAAIHNCLVGFYISMILGFGSLTWGKLGMTRPGSVKSRGAGRRTGGPTALAGEFLNKMIKLEVHSWENHRI